MSEYATTGKANAGLTLGIIGTSLAGLLAAKGTNGTGLGGIFGTSDAGADEACKKN